MTLIQTWITNHTHYEMWKKITYPFPNFNSAIVEVGEWVSNYVLHFRGHVITYPVNPCLWKEPQTCTWGRTRSDFGPDRRPHWEGHSLVEGPRYEGASLPLVPQAAWPGHRVWNLENSQQTGNIIHVIACSMSHYVEMYLTNDYVSFPDGFTAPQAKLHSPILAKHDNLSPK